MKRLLAFSPAVAALFALSIATPRRALLYHEHGGSGHVRVHADGDDLIAALTGHDHEHGHQHQQIRFRLR